MITKQELLFLNILSCAIHNTELTNIEISKEDEIYLAQISQIHNVVPLVYDKTYKYLSQDINNFFKQKTMQQTTLQIMKTDNFSHLYQLFLDHNIKPLVFKGIICRSIYPKPDLRISNDEDLLIKKEDQLKMDQLLTSQGFHRSGEYNDQLEEMEYIHQNGTFLEVHTSLFSLDSPYAFLNDYFSNIFDKSISLTINNQTYYTFDYTQHLIYLFSHCYKHFLHGGFGLRQLCDIIVFMEIYYDKINYDEINQFMTTYSLDCFWYNLLEIAREYLGFDNNRINYIIPSDDIDCEDLLRDLLDSGIYGDSSIERKQSANITLQAVNSQDDNMAGSIFKSLFPSSSYIKDKYSYVKKHSILLPIGYIHRIISYIGQRTHSHLQTSSIEIGKERVELLKKYKIINTK